jgi:glycosyltransferase involved in cell wall biosynthesis
MIDEKIANYRDQVSIFLEFLSNEKLSYCLDAADIVVLPYRKSFDGASGPLGEGVALGKIIVGSNHGSLGDLIEENHLGYTFESENINSLYESIELALSQTFIADSTYKKYKNMLNPAFFVDAYSKLYFTLNDNYSMSEKW